MEDCEMADINVKEKWWEDKRRERLALSLGGFDAADGAALSLLL
jgi:hypothetical protein